MRALAIVISATAIILGAQPFPGPAQEKKPDSIKWNMEYLEKTWGIQLKSVKIEEFKDTKDEKPYMAARMLLEFGKDIEKEELSEVYGNLTAQVVGGKAVGQGRLGFHFFDEENISLGTQVVSHLQGNLTGKKGDAFRITVPIPAVVTDGKLEQIGADKIRKVEVRAREDVKKPKK